MLSTDRLTFFTGVGAIVGTIAAGQCSTNARLNDVNARFNGVNARFDDVNSRLGEIRTDLRGINAWIRDHVTGHPTAQAARTP